MKQTLAIIMLMLPVVGVIVLSIVFSGIKALLVWLGIGFLIVWFCVAGYLMEEEK